MPELSVNGVHLHYVDQGSGPQSVVFSHSYLFDHRHFAPQIEALSRRHRCLAFDHRGHGGSEAPVAGYEMENLYADALGFIEAMQCGPCHFVGLSTGGFIGLRLAIRRPELLRSLVLMDTSAEAEKSWIRLKYAALFLIARVAGFGPVVGTAMKLMFGPAFLNDADRAAQVAEWRQRLTANDRQAMIRFGRGIVARRGVAEQLGEIRVPALMLVGEHDAATPPSKARRIAAGIPGCRLSVIPRAGHLSTVEEPAAVNSALEEFLSGP